MKKPSRRSHRKESSSDIFNIDSRSALREYIQYRPECLLSIRCGKGERDELAAFCEKNGWQGPIEESADSDDIEAKVKLTGCSLESILSERPSCIVALDQVTDARNLGAIVRTCGFFGVRAVVVPQRRAAGYGQAAVATSMGGFAHTDLVTVGNLGRALEELRAAGYSICGAAGEVDAGLEGINGSDHLVLVLGSEGKGLSQGIREKCDMLAAIPGAAQGLESLNVSVACGILINKWFSSNSS